MKQPTKEQTEAYYKRVFGESTEVKIPNSEPIRWDQLAFATGVAVGVWSAYVLIVVLFIVLVIVKG